MHPDVIVAAREELARRFVADLTRQIRAAPAGAPFTLAVPGGSVAEEFLPLLARAPIDWNGVELFWADERAVPPDSPDSNYGLARGLLLEPAGIPDARVHRMSAEEADLREAAAAYARALTAAAGAPPRLDHVLLGVGEDGHVASIFPDDESERGGAVVTWTDRAPKPPARRMSLALETLAAARHVTVAAFGASKAGAIGAALQEGDRSPLGRLLRAAGRPVLLLDEEAAREAGR